VHLTYHATTRQERPAGVSKGNTTTRIEGRKAKAPTRCSGIPVGKTEEDGPTAARVDNAPQARTNEYAADYPPAVV